MTIEVESQLLNICNAIALESGRLGQLQLPAIQASNFNSGAMHFAVFPSLHDPRPGRYRRCSNNPYVQHSLTDSSPVSGLNVTMVGEQEHAVAVKPFGALSSLCYAHYGLVAHGVSQLLTRHVFVSRSGLKLTNI